MLSAGGFPVIFAAVTRGLQFLRSIPLEVVEGGMAWSKLRRHESLAVDATPALESPGAIADTLTSALPTQLIARLP